MQQIIAGTLRNFESDQLWAGQNCQSYVMAVTRVMAFSNLEFRREGLART